MIKFNDAILMIGLYQIMYGFIGFILNDVSTNEELMVGGLGIIVLSLLLIIIDMFANENKGVRNGD